MEKLQKKKKIAARDKPIRKLKNSKLTLDEILHKKVRNTVQALIKENFFLED